MSNSSRDPGTLLAALIQEVQTAGVGGGADVEPHHYKPLKRWHNRGRCAICLIHKDHHPAPGWLPARAYGEMTEAVHLASF